MDQTVEYEYDAFVVYDIEDREWVNERLLPQLEQNSGYPNCTISELEDVQQISSRSVVKLCVHERDFQPGQEIIANIWNKLERSRKVILVVSKNFTGSQYCNYEMNLARMHSVEKGRNVLVPVILEWPDVEQVSECLHWILRKVTYIRWSDRDGEQDDFWQKLREAIALDT